MTFSRSELMLIEPRNEIGSITNINLVELLRVKHINRKHDSAINKEVS